MKNITLLLLCLFVGLNASANHVSSADIWYEYTGTGNNYRIYIQIVKTCEPSASNVTMGQNLTFMVSSSCLSTSYMAWLPEISRDTLEPYCPGTLGTCSSTTSTSPGWIKLVYSDTISVPPCSDWKFSWGVGARSPGIWNLQNPAPSGIYVEAFLNNSLAVNSSGYISNPPTHSPMTGSLYTLPLPAVNIDNDSIAYEWYQPLEDFNGPVPIPYAAGFSLNNPIASSTPFTMNAVNQTLQFTPGLSGQFSLALRVKDYRSGQLVGYSSRDFMLTVAQGTAALTVPLVATGTAMHYNTCPSSTNSITLNFTDSTLTDSVYLTVLPPVIPGFSFNTVTSPASGGASATISWNTPANMNPATLPYFLIGVRARDNNCPNNSFADYAFVVHTAQCSTDSVWAGDANGDYTVSNYDPLAVAVAYGKTGFARPGASSLWQAEFCPDWIDTFINGVNLKHADCNGDGVVDTNDLAPIAANWGNVHLKPGAQAKITGIPDLFFDVAGISFHPGALVSVPIKLGSSASPMNHIYGLGSDISVGGITLSSPPTISYTSSWVATGANALNFTKTNAGNIAAFSWAHARKDHQNISGQGVIATLNFTVPPSAVNGQVITLNFDNSVIVDKDLAPVTAFNEVDASVYVNLLSVNDIAIKINYAVVVPNPSKGATSLHIKASETCSAELRVVDLVGKTVYQERIQLGKGENIAALPYKSLSKGMYFVNLSGNGTRTQAIKWMKD
jgi:hypothetical protein